MKNSGESYQKSSLLRAGDYHAVSLEYLSKILKAKYEKQKGYSVESIYRLIKKSGVKYLSGKYLQSCPSNVRKRWYMLISHLDDASSIILYARLFHNIYNLREISMLFNTSKNRIKSLKKIFRRQYARSFQMNKKDLSRLWHLHSITTYRNRLK